MRRFLNRKNILALEFLGLFLIILVLVYLVVNSPALFQKLKYKTEKIALGNARQGSLDNQSATQGFEEDRLVIPKIGVDTPIIFSDNLEEKIILENLKNGVIHWTDTAFPGEEGNCVITGHSSDFFWHKGKYKTVFTLLNELETNDLAIVYYTGQKFTYRVVNKDIVSSKNIDILSQNKKEPTLTLYTCWPLGTDLRRLVIEAQLL